MTRVRRHFTADQKAQVVRRHLAGKEAVSTLAEELGVQPTQIHQWVQQLLAQAERAFERTVGSRRVDETKDREVAQERFAERSQTLGELLGV
jgi:transposase-like protein